MTARRMTGRAVMAERARWHARLAIAAATGAPLSCVRCGAPLDPDTAWDLDHIERLSDGGADDAANMAPSHARCNRSDGGKISARLRGRYRPWGNETRQENTP